MPPETADGQDAEATKNPLPFSGKATPPPSALAELPDKVEDPLAKTSLGDFDEAARLARSVLPFVSAGNPPPNGASSTPHDEASAEGASDPNAATLQAAGDDSPAAAPARPSNPAALPSLSVEQYASLHAEIAAFPSREGATLARYHLPDGSARRALDKQWHQKFEDAPALYEKWKEHYARYLAWLKKQGP